MNKICPNKRIENPILCKVVTPGEYCGKIGWRDAAPNEFGIVRFCSLSGENPHQWNTSPIHFEDLKI